MSKRPLPISPSGGPRKKSSFRFARNPSEVVANSSKVGQLPSGRIKQTKQTTPSVLSSSSIAGQEEPLPQDQPLQLEDLSITDDLQVDNMASEDLSTKPKRKKRTNTTLVSKIHYNDHLI